MAALPILVDAIIAKGSRSALIWIKKSAFFRSASRSSNSASGQCRSAMRSGRGPTLGEGSREGRTELSCPAGAPRRLPCLFFASRGSGHSRERDCRRGDAGVGGVPHGNYDAIGRFRGIISRRKLQAPEGFERANHIRILQGYFASKAEPACKHETPARCEREICGPTLRARSRVWPRRKWAPARAEASPGRAATGGPGTG